MLTYYSQYKTFLIFFLLARERVRLNFCYANPLPTPQKNKEGQDWSYCQAQSQPQLQTNILYYVKDFFKQLKGVKDNSPPPQPEPWTQGLSA